MASNYSKFLYNQYEGLLNKFEAQEIPRLKSKNNKDSSNSSKPSGTNGHKKVISNNNF